MKDGDYSDQLKAAFLQTSERVLPNIVWTQSKNDGLVYPEQSPALGRLEVEFADDEITLYFGWRGYHQHHSLEDGVPVDQREPAIQAVAAEALEFVGGLVSDQVVFRWGLSVSGVQTKRPPTVFSRTWRRLTPWVKEAVWSGRAVGGNVIQPGS